MHCEQKPNENRDFARRLTRFAQDQSGAVAVEWVVMVAAVIGLGVATISGVSSGASNSSSEMSSALQAYEIQSDFAASAFSSAESFYDFGIAASPDSKNGAWAAARAKAGDEAPDGFNYDPERQETRYVDTASGNPIYESNSGDNYSIGGAVIAAEDYSGNKQSFYAGFSAYWNQL